MLQTSSQTARCVVAWGWELLSLPGVSEGRRSSSRGAAQAGLRGLGGVRAPDPVLSFPAPVLGTPDRNTPAPLHSTPAPEFSTPAPVLSTPALTLNPSPSRTSIPKANTETSGTKRQSGSQVGRHLLHLLLLVEYLLPSFTCSYSQSRLPVMGGNKTKVPARSSSQGPGGPMQERNRWGWLGCLTTLY